MTVRVLKALASPRGRGSVLPSDPKTRADARFNTSNGSLPLRQTWEGVRGVENRVSEETGQVPLCIQLLGFLEGLEHLRLHNLVQLECFLRVSRLEGRAVWVTQRQPPTFISSWGSTEMFLNNQKSNELRSWLASHWQEGLGLVVRVNNDWMVLQLKTKSEKEQSSGRVCLQGTRTCCVIW